METNQPTIKCRVCGAKIPITGMAVDEGNNLLCRKCKGAGKATQTIVKETPKAPMPKGSKWYQCMSCKYRFQRSPSSTQALKCPYCAGTDVKESDDSAQRLIDEVADFDENKFFRQ